MVFALVRVYTPLMTCVLFALIATLTTTTATPTATQPTPCGEEGELLHRRIAELEYELQILKSVANSPTTLFSDNGVRVQRADGSISSWDLIDAANTTQRDVLTDFYFAAGGPHWTYAHTPQSKWLSAYNECTWEFVECNGAGAVESLYFNSSIGMKGKLTPLLRFLTHLRVLVLEGGSLTASDTGIEWLCTLPHLTVVNLNHNPLATTFPSCLGDLRNLTTLSLYNCKLTENELSAALAGICNLSVIEHLDLGWNSLPGTLPPGIGHVSSLKLLHLSGVGVNASVPQSLSMLGGLQSLDLSSNVVDGFPWDVLSDLGCLHYLNLSSNTLSSVARLDITRAANLSTFDISHNKFWGKLPLINNATRISKLYMSDNQFSGGLEEWAPLQFVDRQIAINVSDNALTGSIPGWLASINHLDVFSAARNLLTGTLPTTLGQHVYLRQIDVSGNQLGGTIPTFALAVSLESLDLSENEFVGGTPEGIHTSLLSLDLSMNRLDGSIASDIATPSLRYLDLSNNLLTGTIPSNLGEMHSLLTLSLSNNVNLAGTIPNDFLQMTELREFDVYNTNVGGGIPSSLGACAKLAMLEMTSCNLTGTIPMELGAAESLTFLSLADNNLEGEIPVSFSGLINLQELYLHINRLEGTVPQGLLDLSSIQIWDLSENQLEGSLLMMTGMSNAIVFNAFSNLFSGLVCISNAPLLSELRLANNKLHEMCALNGLKMLEVLDISGNEFNCTLEEIIENLPSAQWEEGSAYISLREINVGGNNVTGTIPISINNFYGLTTLGLNDNQLHGDLSVFSSASRSSSGFSAYNMVLQVLNLQNNEFGGPIDYLGSLLAVELLLLEGNKNLTTLHPGKLPNWLVATTEHKATGSSPFSCPVLTGRYQDLYIVLNASVYEYSLCTCLDGWYGYNGVCQPCPLCNCTGHSVSGCYPSPIKAGDRRHKEHGVQLVDFMPCATSGTHFTPCNPRREPDFTCAEGYEGLACLVCTKDHYPLGVFCYACSVWSTSAYFVFYFIFLCFNSWCLYAFPYSARARIFINYGQTLMILVRPAMPWPSWFSKSLHFLSSALNYDVLALTCGIRGPSRFYLSMFLAISQMLVVTLLGLVIALYFGTIKWKQRNYAAKRALILVFLQLNFFTALRAFQATPFACSQDPGNYFRFFRSFPDVSCDSSVGKTMEVVAFIMSAFVVITPVTILYGILRNNVKVDLPYTKWLKVAWVEGIIKDTRAGNVSDPRDRGAGALGIIASPYRDKVWYWEVVVVLRKIGFAACVAFVPSLNDQIIFLFLLLIMIAALSVQSAIIPFAEKSDNVLEAITLSALLIAVRSGMVTGSSAQNSAGWEKTAAGDIAMVWLISAFMAFPIVVAFKYFFPHVNPEEYLMRAVRRESVSVSGAGKSGGGAGVGGGSRGPTPVNNGVGLSSTGSGRDSGTANGGRGSGRSSGGSDASENTPLLLDLNKSGSGAGPLQIEEFV